MADITYPTSLRGAIQSTKQITKSAGFLESSPAAGASYTVAWTEDQPTIFSFDLKFSDTESMRFDAWQRSNKIFDQGLFFNFPIGDVYGITWQEVRFISGGVPTLSDTGRVSSYSGCQVLIPDYVKPDAEFITDFLDTGITIDEVLIFDVAINQTWPV